VNKSESIAELAKALNKFQSRNVSVKKTSVNPFFHSKYADLASIWDACRDELTKNELSVSQVAGHNESGIVIETILMHNSGEWISGSQAINPIKNEPQAIGSAITYARRYALAAILGLVADEDDDAEASQGRDKLKVNPTATAVKPTPTEETATQADYPMTLTSEPITAEQKERLQELQKKLPGRIKELIEEWGWNVKAISKLTKDQANHLIEKMEKE